MGLTARIYGISSRSYDAARAGKSSEFELDPSVVGLDLDKAWHVIHYVIIGDPSLTFLRSGTQVPGVSEHCEVHSPEAVEALRVLLSERTAQEMVAAATSSLIADERIYPGGWPPHSITYVTQYLERFTVKIGEFADRRLGMLVAIN